jgi:hypothetical protein
VVADVDPVVVDVEYGIVGVGLDFVRGGGLVGDFSV